MPAGPHRPIEQSLMKSPLTEQEDRARVQACALLARAPVIRLTDYRTKAGRDDRIQSPAEPGGGCRSYVLFKGALINSKKIAERSATEICEKYPKNRINPQ